MEKDNGFRLRTCFGMIWGQQTINKKKQFLDKAEELRKRGIGQKNSLEVLRQLRGYED